MYFFVQVGLGDLFGEQLAVSQETGYSWATTDTATFDIVNKQTVSSKIRR